MEYPERFHDTLEKAIADQQKIGWRNVMKGYLSVEWQQALSMTLYDNDTTQEGRGPFYIKQILKAVYTTTRQLWLARNQELHGESTKELDKIRSAETAEIKEYYQHPELIPAADRHYCERPLATLLEKNPSTRRRWLRHMRMARHRFVVDGIRQPRITSFIDTSPGDR